MSDEPIFCSWSYISPWALKLDLISYVSCSLIISRFLTKNPDTKCRMNQSSALDLKSPLERGGPLAVGCVLFEARLTSIRLAEFYRMYNSSRDWSVCAICSCQEPTTALSGLFQGSGFSSPQRPTPSATSWPSSLKGGFKIKIIRSQIQLHCQRRRSIIWFLF